MCKWCIAFFCGVTFLVSATAQTTYRWLDQNGSVHYSDQPPPPAIKAEQKKLGTPNAIVTSGPGYAMQQAAAAQPVVLYVSPDCGRECNVARDFLREQRVPFSEKQVKTTEDAVAFQKATGNKELFVPTLLVGGAAQTGYESGAWRKLLIAAGYPIAERATAP